MTDSELVEQYFAKLKAQDADAPESLCLAYYEKLAAIARRQFGEFPMRVADEYAIANDVLRAFHERMQRGDFSEVREPAELLMVLSRLTKDRVVDEIRRHTAQKRGGGHTRGNSIFHRVGDRFRNGEFDRFQSDQDTPSAQQILAEQVDQLLQKLNDTTLRTILVLRLEGLTNEEIAEQLKVSVATIERKRRRIRERLADVDSIGFDRR